MSLFESNFWVAPVIITPYYFFPITLPVLVFIIVVMIPDILSIEQENPRLCNPETVTGIKL